MDIQCIGNDISERKRAELEKFQAQENLQLLMNNTEESFMMIGKESAGFKLQCGGKQKGQPLSIIFRSKKGFRYSPLMINRGMDFMRQLYQDVFEGKGARN